MTQTAHTPGPWWIEPVGTIRNDADGNPRYDLPRIVRFGDGHSICKAHLIGGNDPDQALANARLIAAAPDLLEALEAMIEEWIDYATLNNLGDPGAKHNIKLARAAIAKAKGGVE